MSTLPKYNFLPGAYHFLPFSSGEETHFQYSYTPKKMYCKIEITTEDEKFQYVEVVDINKDTLDELNQMSTNDYIGPMQLFHRLSIRTQSDEDLHNLLREYNSLIIDNREQQKKASNLHAESEEYMEHEFQINSNDNRISDIRSQIEEIIGKHNQKSGYNSSINCIRKNRNKQSKIMK